MLPFVLAKLAGIAPLALANSGLVMGLSRLVALRGTIAFEFARYGRAVAMELSGDIRATEPLAAQYVDLVSFFPGQVCVVHRASFRLAGQKEHPIHS